LANRIISLHRRVFGLDSVEDASEETLRFEKCFRHFIVEGIKKHILCSITFIPPPKINAICEIMLKNIVEQSGPQMTISPMGMACLITKATNTHTQVV
jgi:hypothetical protein